jgi:hypothetical protein
VSFTIITYERQNIFIVQAMAISHKAFPGIAITMRLSLQIHWPVKLLKKYKTTQLTEVPLTTENDKILQGLKYWRVLKSFLRSLYD